MRLPSVEQLLRIGELIKDGKLTEIGIQEALDRYKELEFSGLYKRIVQSARGLMPLNPRWEQLAELAGITGDLKDYTAAFDAATVNSFSGGEAEYRKVKALLSLGRSFPRSGDSTSAAARRRVDRLVTWEQFAFAFNAMRDIFIATKSPDDYAAMCVLCHRQTDERELVRTLGECSKLSSGESAGRFRDAALEKLQSWPINIERFDATLALAKSCVDEKCFAAAVEFGGLKSFSVISREYVRAHLLWLRLYYEKSGIAVLTDLAELSPDATNAPWYAPLVMEMVKIFCERGDYYAAGQLIGQLPHPEVKLAALLLLESQRTVGFSEDVWTQKLFTHNLDPQLELRYRLGLAAETGTPVDKQAARDCVEKLGNGYLSGLVDVAAAFGEASDAVNAYDSISASMCNCFEKIELLLPLLKSVKERLDELKK